MKMKMEDIPSLMTVEMDQKECLFLAVSVLMQMAAKLG